MKKKLILSILALVCAMACAFAFTACGKDEVTPENLEGDVVTAEQWAEVFKAENFNNVKIEVSYTSVHDYAGDDNDTKMTVKTTMIIAGNDQYRKSELTVAEGSQEFKDSLKGIDAENYSTGSNGSHFFYSKDASGKWQRVGGVVNGVVDSAISDYFKMATMFDKFEYLDGSKGYRLKMDYRTEYEELRGIFKFKDGKLAAIYHDANNFEEGHVTQIVSFTYGGQKLTLPTT